MSEALDSSTCSVCRRARTPSNAWLHEVCDEAAKLSSEQATFLAEHLLRSKKRDDGSFVLALSDGCGGAVFVTGATVESALAAGKILIDRIGELIP